MPQPASESELDESPAAFACRLLRAMYAVAREAGLKSAYPDTRAGKSAALKAELRTYDSFPEWGSDFQRSLVLQEIRRLQQEPPMP